MTREYSRTLVSFLDVLGFRNLLLDENCGHVHDLLENLGRAFLHSVHVRVNRLDSGRMKCLNSSDSFVRTSVIEGTGTEQVRRELFDLAIVLQHQVRKGVFLRGAVVVGNVFHEEASPLPETRTPPVPEERPRPGISYCYGQALVDAHDIEKTTGAPKVVVHPDVLAVCDPAEYALAEWYVEAAGLGDCDRARLVRKDPEGVFIDYLSVAPRSLLNTQSSQDFTGDDPEEYGDLLEKHKEFTQKLLGKALCLPKGPERDSILCKARWLKNYHNEVIDRIPRGVLASLKLERDELLVA